MKVITTEKKPIKMWLDGIEEGALNQAKNMANLPFTFKHVAIMPDAHQGYGMPIGGVLATERIIIPNAVGVDIGCGMCVERTPFKEISQQQLIDVRNRIMELVPVGFNHHADPQDPALMPSFDIPLKTHCIIRRENEKAQYQLGTLGGGNHFIEIQKGDDGYIWIMIHSGSRNLGFKVAKYYNDLAQQVNRLWYSEVDKSMDLAFLPIHDKFAAMYLKEMQYCVEFAEQNRYLMLSRVNQAFKEVIKNGPVSHYLDIAHNYARWENHFNTNVIVHRKGATSAKLGEMGIIPGSQGTKSYIVKGLGNPMSFNSCSHGAGRVMGRKQAIQNLDLKEQLEKMGNVIHNITTEKELDEAPGAYKDIDQVMNNQKDLVEIVTELTPLAVIKG